MNVVCCIECFEHSWGVRYKNQCIYNLKCDVQYQNGVFYLQKQRNTSEVLLEFGHIFYKVFVNTKNNQQAIDGFKRTDRKWTRSALS